MSPQVIAAIIAAIASFVALFLNLLISARSRALVLAAESSARRADELRSRAMRAGEAVLGTLGEHVISLLSLAKLVERTGTTDERNVVDGVSKAASAAAKTRRLLFRTAPYLSRELTARLTDVLENNQIDLKLKIEPDNRAALVGDLRATASVLQEAHAELADYFRSVARLGESAG